MRAGNDITGEGVRINGGKGDVNMYAVHEIKLTPSQDIDSANTQHHRESKGFPSSSSETAKASSRQHHDQSKQPGQLSAHHHPAPQHHHRSDGRSPLNHNDTSNHSLSLGYCGGSAASTVFDNLTNNVLGNAFNSTGLPKDQQQTSVTQSVISPGNSRRRHMAAVQAVDQDEFRSWGGRHSAELAPQRHL